jgi:DNA-binding MarR family transcriptional regulator
MNDDDNSIAVSLFSEIVMTDQLMRNRLTKVLPKGMEISHFSVLNALAYTSEERTPAQLANLFNLTRGAMTNTLNKLEWAGYIHIRPDWDDARRKMVSISPSGRAARDQAVATISPIITEIVGQVGSEKVRSTLPVLRELRKFLSES